LGLFEVWADDWLLVEAYRFGSRTADYLLCRRCGVYVGAVCDTEAGLRAVVNVNALDDRAAFVQAPATPDYDGETTEARLSRRAVNSGCRQSYIAAASALARSDNRVADRV
jgi:hypothetical protein